MSEILPCPFCASLDAELHVGYYCRDDGEYPAIICNDCGAAGPEPETFDNSEAVSLWNGRGDVPSVDVLYPGQIAAIDALLSDGLYGDSRAEVIRFLISHALQDMHAPIAAARAATGKS